MSEELDSLLAGWHMWRRAYTTERGYARPRHNGSDHDAVLENDRWRCIDELVAQLPRLEQIAVQHFARAQAMGVEVLIHPQLLEMDMRDATVERAVLHLEHLLLRNGVISP